MTQKRQCRGGGEEGSVLVEAAATLVALVLLVFGAIQFALVFWSWNTMLLAVEEAGRYAMLYSNFPSGPPGCTAGSLADCAAAWANNYNWGSTFDSPGVACTQTGPNMTCTVSYTALDFINSFTLSRAITVPVI